MLWAIARFAGLPRSERPLFILLLAQGGEFAFVLLTLGVQREVLREDIAQAMTLAVALSMLSTPFLLALHDRVLAPRFADEAPSARTRRRRPARSSSRAWGASARWWRACSTAAATSRPSSTTTRTTSSSRAASASASSTATPRASTCCRPRAPRSADFLIIALDDPGATTRLARIAIKHFPKLRVIARARDMRHMFELRDLGVEIIERETFESALALGRASLAAMSGDAERAQRATLRFAEHDNVVLSKLYAVHTTDLDANVSMSNELREQFARTLREDEAAIAARAKDPAGRPAG